MIWKTILVPHDFSSPANHALAIARDEAKAHGAKLLLLHIIDLPFSLKPETVKTRLHRARTMLRDNVEKKIGPVVMEAFPFAGKRCERLTDAVLKRLGY